MSFCYTISNIVSVCANVKVFRSDTSWIVAFVQHTHPLRDFANMQFIGETVRENFEIASVDSNLNSPIPSSVKMLSPNPTILSFMNLIPEALRCRPRSMRTVAALTAKLPNRSSKWGKHAPTV